MKNLIFLFVVVFFFSCSKNEQEPTNVAEDIGVLVFKDFNEFFKEYDSLAKLSREELSDWTLSKNHHSLLSSEKSSDLDYSYTLMTLLNSNFEVQIGNDIVWFDNKKIKSLDKNSYSLTNRKNKSLEIGDLLINTNNPDKVENRTILLYSNTKDARNQKEIWQKSYKPCGSGEISNVQGKRKFVHELMNETILLDQGFFRTSIYLRLKLEWKGSGGWRPAGEQRNITVNVVGTVAGSPYSINTTFSCSNDQQIFLDGFISLNDPVLVGMTGSIIHSIIGDDPSNTYNNTGTLW